MRLVGGLVAILLLAACAGSPLPQPASGEGTVTGSVIISPCTPVERAGDPPCPPRPGVSVQFKPVGGGAVVKTVTDANGTYSVRLPAGTYDAEAGGGIGPGRPVRLTVAAGGSLTQNFSVDSGIR